MEQYNHYYVITEVFDEQPKANYVMHSPEALLSVAAHIYTEWAQDAPEDYATTIEFSNEVEN